MRELTAKQKQLLIKWYNEAEPSEKDKFVLMKVNPLRTADDLTGEQWDELKAINDTEVLYQKVNSFLWELK